MCGLAGFLARGHQRSIASLELAHALGRISHRGPDGNDTWFDACSAGESGIGLGIGIGLGHVRLAILDVSSAASQPMISKDSRWAMAFNGEVYNFAEIRRLLEADGGKIQSSGDTEVILEAFAKWGLEAVHRFIGMFAIALWDRHKEELYLIRDRVGVKPLYYARTPSTTLFASELKALRSFSAFSPKIDVAAVGEYLRYGYLSEQTSVFHDTHKVKPGCWVHINRLGECVEHRYWSVEDRAHTSGSRSLSDGDWTERIEALVTDSAKLRMISDVPIGIFLSGGIDSSLVTALAQRQASGPVKTFTIGFEVADLNEAEHAKHVANFLGTEHTEYIMPASEALKMLSEWSSLYDEPFGDSSGLPTLLVSRAASQSVKVVLSADGGDELFSGYGRYALALSRWESLKKIPGPVRRTMAKAIYRLPFERWDGQLASGAYGTPNHALRYKTTWRALKLREQLSVNSSEQLYDLAQSHFSGRAIQELVGTLPYPRRSSSDYSGDSAERFAQWDFDHYLPGDILTKVDRATMYSSIEGREPLLDHRLVEAAFQLPAHLKRGTLGTKHILKEILFRHVPKGLLDRPKKGFAVPMEAWLRGPLRALLHSTLMTQGHTFGGVLNPAVVKRYVNQFETGDRTLTTPVWLLLAFELWRQGWQAA